MLCFLLLAAICPVFSQTITPVQPLSSATTWPYSSFFNTVKQGPPDQTGSFLITQNANGEDLRDIYCDDFWNDYEAEKLCQMWNFKFGKRGFQNLADAQERYYGIMPHCYSWSHVYSYTLIAIEVCSTEVFTTEQQNCAKDQVASVYCWDVEYFHKFEYITHTASKKKWNLEFKMFNVKYGRKHNVIGEDSLIRDPKTKHFQIKGCQKAVSGKLTVNEQNQSMKLKGKWADKKCEKCLELFYMGEKIFPELCLKRKMKEKKKDKYHFDF